MALLQKKLQQRQSDRTNKPTLYYNHSSFNDNGYDTLKKDKRIIEILFPGMSLEAVPEVDSFTLNIYLSYLKYNLPKGGLVTGIQDLGYFQWEKRYISCVDRKEEYHNLKQLRASYTDKLAIVEIEGFEDEVGIIVSVERITDQKIFSIPLKDLKGCDNNPEFNQLINDYIYWKLNFPWIYKGLWLTR